MNDTIAIMGVNEVWRQRDRLTEAAIARANWDLLSNGEQRATLEDYWNDQEAEEYGRLEAELDAYYEEELG